MLSKTIKISIPKSFDLNILKEFTRVILMDSTAFQLPEELADVFPASGGQASGAGIKVQFGYDLKSDHFFYLIHEGNIPDNGCNSDLRDTVNQGDLFIRDLGYYNVSSFANIANRGGYYLSRLRAVAKVYIKSESGALSEEDLLLLADSTDDGVTEYYITITTENDYINTRLVLERVPTSVFEQRLRRINATDKRKRRTTSERTKKLQAFNFFISNIPTEFILVSNIRRLYSVRWQIELIFKNWKSNFGLDKVSGYREERIRCMIYAKLILAFVTHKLYHTVNSIVWVSSKREVSEFRLTKQILIKANEWIRLLVLEAENMTPFLNNTIELAIKLCQKIKQKDRVYPLEMLEDLA